MTKPISGPVLPALTSPVATSAPGIAPSIPSAGRVSGNAAEDLKRVLGGGSSAFHEMMKIAGAIRRLAPPSDPFRKELVHWCQMVLMSDGFPYRSPLTLEGIKMMLLILVGFSREITREPRLLFAEPRRYLGFLPKVYEIILSIARQGVAIVDEKGKDSLEKTYRDLMHGAALRERDPRWKRREAPDHEILGQRLDWFLRVERLQDLKRILKQEVFTQDALLGEKRVAVVGYGINVETILFFLDLGFQVTAVEKHGASEGWSENFANYVSRPEPLLEAVGLSEVAVQCPHWRQFTSQEASQAVGFSSKLSFADAADTDLPLGTFDLVVAPALVDEASETAACLPKAGGYVLADHYQHPIYHKTRNGSRFQEFASSLGLKYESRFDQVFRLNERVLPVDYRGSHSVYLLKRTG